MTTPWIVAAIAAVAAALLNSIITPWILSISHRKNWVDQPNHRTVHKEPVPRLGGVGMVASIVLVLFGLLLADFV